MRHGMLDIVEEARTGHLLLEDEGTGVGGFGGNSGFGGGEGGATGSDSSDSSDSFDSSNDGNDHTAAIVKKKKTTPTSDASIFGDDWDGSLDDNLGDVYGTSDAPIGNTYDPDSPMFDDRQFVYDMGEGDGFKQDIYKDSVTGGNIDSLLDMFPDLIQAAVDPWKGDAEYFTRSMDPSAGGGFSTTGPGFVGGTGDGDGGPVAPAPATGSAAAPADQISQLLALLQGQQQQQSAIGMAGLGLSRIPTGADQRRRRTTLFR